MLEILTDGFVDLSESETGDEKTNGSFAKMVEPYCFP